MLCFFWKLKRELQKTLREYLEARGVNDELSFFLLEYLLNKDRIELIQWFGKVKSFVVIGFKIILTDCIARIKALK